MCCEIKLRSKKIDQRNVTKDTEEEEEVEEKKSIKASFETMCASKFNYNLPN